jgi:hypothetical protein
MVTSRWLKELPEDTRISLIRLARQGALHPDPVVAAESVEWARKMRPGGVGYGTLNLLVVILETILGLLGFGTPGEESSVSERVAAKRIIRIANVPKVPPP